MPVQSTFAKSAWAAAFIAIITLLTPAVANAVSLVTLHDLKCDHEQNPIGIGNQQPRLSWKIRSDLAGEVQAAYQIRAASSPTALKENKADLWDSGKVTSDQSVLV